ncbi:MAG: peptidase prepilin type [Lachnospiraceae bacterium]|jgi:prepilin peptidase CpaA|nr:peptidase prepilin type [Lachnospiraceae bacterium]
MSNFINIIILIPTILLASYFDLKIKKIPNLLTFPVILLGMLTTSLVSGFKGLQFSILGFLFGMAVFFIPFAFNLMGGGDVKLMGAIGALMGWRFSLSAVIYSSVVGGVIVVIIVVFNKRLMRLITGMLSIIITPISRFLYLKTGKEIFYKKFQYFDNKNINRKKEYIPYGVAITIGTLLVLSEAVPRII